MVATLTHPEVDSRAYAFVYPVRGREHLPADFLVDAEFDKVISGVFLPQEQCGRFNKPRYPAHILLLLPHVLIAATHPSAGVAEVRIPTSNILTIESFRILLDGRLTLSTARTSHQWRYNTREGRHLDGFLFQLRRLTMPGEDKPQKGSAFVFGAPLDLKFASAETSELDPGERVLATFFSPPRRLVRKGWLFATHVWQPGDYIALTSRRILWITDRDDGRRAEYGTISRYASIRNLLGLELSSRDDTSELTVQLSASLCWPIPVPADLRTQAVAFVNEVHWLNDCDGRERIS
jgi:hypothetical protein